MKYEMHFKFVTNCDNICHLGTLGFLWDKQFLKTMIRRYPLHWINA